MIHSIERAVLKDHQDPRNRPSQPQTVLLVIHLLSLYILPNSKAMFELYALLISQTLGWV